MVFSVIDVVAALTESVNPRDYWFKMKVHVKTEDGLELSTICRQLKMKAPDGKIYPQQSTATFSTPNFTYDFQSLSLTVLRVPVE